MLQSSDNKLFKQLSNDNLHKSSVPSREPIIKRYAQKPLMDIALKLKKKKPLSLRYDTFWKL